MENNHFYGENAENNRIDAERKLQKFFAILTVEVADTLNNSGVLMFSGTHLAHSNYRVMPICVGVGEACGAAAAIAIKNNIPLRSVSPEEIRHELGRE